jgi:hypothetical protein
MGLIDSIKKNVKGAVGELKVDIILRGFTFENCFSIRDLLLVRDGKSTQIDNILFTYKRVYIIETKNYSGWIHGSEMGKSWTQTFNFYGKVTKSIFYNPLTQNYGHIKFFSKFFDLPLTSFVNIVVFSNAAELKNITTEKNYNHVINLRDLKHLINDIEMNSEVIFDWEDLERFEEAVNSLDKSGFCENQKHKRNVKEIVKRYEK